MSLENVFDASPTLEKLRCGPLGNIMDGFCNWLLDAGYNRGSIRRIVSHASHLNQFLESPKKETSYVLSDKDIDDFFKAYPKYACNRGPLDKHVRCVQWSIHRFVQYLAQVGRFEPKLQQPVFVEILEDYLLWMRNYRHDAPGTLDNRRRSISVYLEWLGDNATYQGVAGLTQEQVEQFFLAYAQNAGSSAKRAMQSALRTFFRFCLQKGFIQNRLDTAVPTLPTYKLATVPRGVSDEQAQTLLGSVNRNTPVGRRDYAIIQLLYTYGVRGGQVRNLQLTDIHWSTNQILFKASKHGKESFLPLTEDVGKSLLAYLKTARPHCTCLEIFLTSKAPYHPLDRSSTLSEIIRRYIIKADIKIPSKGSHTLRHCFATRMVQAGHSLKSVADVLGHRYLSTTFIYTKVNFNALKQVALEWPGEVLK